MGGGRLSIVSVKLLFILCTQVGPGEGCLMGGMLDSSLILLPFSSLRYSKERSISFTSSCLNYLGNWFVCFAIFVCLMLVTLCYALTKD